MEACESVDFWPTGFAAAAAADAAVDDEQDDKVVDIVSRDADEPT